MKLPLFTSLTHGYERRWVRGDVLAGLTVWAVLVPEALAYASIAGAEGDGPAIPTYPTVQAAVEAAQAGP